MAPVYYLETLSNSMGKVPKQSALYVRVRAEGVEGWGEAPCLDARGYSEDDLENAIASLRSELGARKEGLDLRAYRGGPYEVSMKSGAARVALEAASCSVLATMAGTTLISWLGQELRVKDREEEASDCLGVGIAVPYAISPAELSWRLVHAAEQGVARIKIKVSPSNISNVIAVLKEGSFGGEVVLDANGSFTRDRPLPTKSLAEAEVRAVEQPYAPGTEDLAEKASELLDILYDESAMSAAWVHRHVMEAQSRRLGVVLKPFRLGPLFEVAALARDLAVEARPFYFGGMYESSLGKLFLAGLHLALAAPLVSDLSLALSNDPFDALVLQSPPQGRACLRARGSAVMPAAQSTFMQDSHKVFSWGR